MFKTFLFLIKKFTLTSQKKDMKKWDFYYNIFVQFTFIKKLNIDYLRNMNIQQKQISIFCNRYYNSLLMPAIST